MKPMPRTRVAGKRPVSRFLLGMNAVLLLLIALVMWSPTVQAQLGLRGHYLLVAGAGESEMLPMCAFIAYDVADNVSVAAFVGANVAGSLKATNTSRTTVWETDYDATPVVGIQATISF